MVNVSLCLRAHIVKVNFPFNRLVLQCTIISRTLCDKRKQIVHMNEVIMGMHDHSGIASVSLLLRNDNIL